MQDYYNRRATEYEAIYTTPDPARQAELAAIKTEVASLMAGKRVLEIACGTGYWTDVAAHTSFHITATDASEEMLQVARAKSLSPDRVSFLIGDAYDLNPLPGEFDAALANFWFSHIPRARINEFLTGLQSKILPGAVVFMSDNVYVPGGGGDLVHPPGSADTYKLRTLSDGSQHLVLKNYYDEDQLRAILAPFSTQLSVHVGSAYWWFAYRTP